MLYAVSNTSCYMQSAIHHVICSEWYIMLCAVSNTSCYVQWVIQYVICSQQYIMLYAVSDTACYMQWVIHHVICSEWYSMLYDTAFYMQWVIQLFFIHLIYAFFDTASYIYACFDIASYICMFWYSILHMHVLQSLVIKWVWCRSMFASSDAASPMREWCSILDTPGIGGNKKLAL